MEKINLGELTRTFAEARAMVYPTPMDNPVYAAEIKKKIEDYEAMELACRTMMRRACDAMMERDMDSHEAYVAAALAIGKAISCLAGYQPRT